MLHGDEIRDVAEGLQKDFLLTIFECTVDDLHIDLCCATMLVEEVDFFNELMKDAATARMRIRLVIKPLDRDANAS